MMLTRNSTLALMLLAGSAAPALGQTYSWTGNQTIHWHNAQNWDPQAIPGNGSATGVTAFIGPGPGFVDLGNGDPVILSSLGAFRTLRIFGRLQTSGQATLVDMDFFHNGVVDGSWINSGTIRFQGTNNLWSGGKIVGGLIENTGTITLGATGPGRQAISNLSDTSFRNNGDAIVQGTLALYDDAEVVNNTTMTLAGGQVTPAFLQPPATAGHFRNMGTLIVNSGQIFTVFLNLGTIQVPGALTLRGFTMIIFGDIEIPAGGLVDVLKHPDAVAGDPTLGCNITGQGTMRLLNSYHRISEPTSVALNNPVGGFIVDTDFTVDILTTLTNRGNFRWNRGRLWGSGAFINTTLGQVIWGQGGATTSPLDVNWTNQGSIRVRGAQRIMTGRTLDIHPSGDLFMEGSVVRPAEGDPGKIICRGLIMRPAGVAGGAGIGVPLEMLHESTISVQEGPLSLGDFGWTGPRTRWSGRTTVALGTGASPRLILQNGVHEVLSGEMEVTGKGKMEVAGSATLVVEGGRIVNLVEDNPSSEFLVDGTLTTTMGSGSFFINSGRMRISGTVDTGAGNATLLNELYGDLYFSSGFLLGKLRNQGIIIPSPTMQVGTPPATGNRPGAVYNEDGIIRLGVNNGNAGIHLNHPDSLIYNIALIEKVGTGAASIRGIGMLSNRGTVHARQGILSIESQVEQLQGQPPNQTLTGGTWLVDEGAELRIHHTIVGIGPDTEVIGDTTRMPWLPTVRRVEGRAQFLRNSTMIAPLKVASGGMVQIDPPAQLTVPGGMENGELEDILNQIVHVFVPTRNLQPRLITPVLHNHSRLVPGGHEAPGPFNLTGDLLMYPTGRILVEIGGLQPLLEHDSVAITGAAALAGTLDLSLIDQFEPELGQQFTILTASAGRTGQFDAIAQPASMPPGRSFQAIYTPTAVIVEVVAGCYANCDASTTAPILNIADFSCFLSRFAAGDAYANCDASTTAPVLNIADFGCFLQSFAAGCP